MFQKKPALRPPSENHQGYDDVKTFLGPGTEFIGRVVFSGTLRIDGFVDGEIEGSDTVVIGGSGRMNGTCRTGGAIISGTVDGEIIAARTVILKDGARVTGRIETPALVVEQGASFNGTSIMPETSTGPTAVAEA